MDQCMKFIKNVFCPGTASCFSGPYTQTSLLLPRLPLSSPQLSPAYFETYLATQDIVTYGLFACKEDHLITRIILTVDYPETTFFLLSI